MIFFDPYFNHNLTYSLTSYSLTLCNALASCKKLNLRYHNGPQSYESAFLYWEIFFSVLDTNNFENPTIFLVQYLISKFFQSPIYPHIMTKWLREYRFLLADYNTAEYWVNEITELKEAFSSNYLSHEPLRTLKKLNCLKRTNTKLKNQSLTRQKLNELTNLLINKIKTLPVNLMSIKM